LPCPAGEALPVATLPPA